MEKRENQAAVRRLQLFMADANVQTYLRQQSGSETDGPGQKQPRARRAQKESEREATYHLYSNSGPKITKSRVDACVWVQIEAEIRACAPIEKAEKASRLAWHSLERPSAGER